MSSPKIITRDKNGLIEGLDYKFTSDGLVDWKSMVDPKFIYVNPSNKSKMEQKYKKSYFEIDPLKDNVDERDLVIMLGGLKQLLLLRGYNSVRYNIKEANETYSAVSCNIIFSPNYESEMKEVEFSDNGCATLQNTDGFGQKYLLELATNRSLCRAIRSYLRINIVSKEEISIVGSSEPEEFVAPQSNQQVNLLIECAGKRNFTFEHIKKKLINEKFEGAENFKNWSDIPKEKVFELIDRLKNSEKEKK